MTDPIRVRVSSLPAYADCKGRTAARIFDRDVEAFGYTLRQTERGIGSVIGSAVHRGASVTLTEKARTGELPPMSVATDCANDDLKEAIAQGVMYDGSKGVTMSAREAGIQTISMTRVYWRAVAPLLHPILVEERLEAEFAPGIILSGQADIVAREPNAVDDLKTSAKKGPGNHAAQLGGYALLARTPTERHPEGLQIDQAAITQIQRVRPDKPQPEPIHHRVDVALAETAAVKILSEMVTDLKVFREGDAARRILPGDSWAFLKNPSSTLCSEKFCPAFGVRGPHAFCREWQQKESQ